MNYSRVRKYYRVIKFFRENGRLIKYGSLLGLCLGCFKAVEFMFYSYKITLETYLLIVSLAFLFIGSYIGSRLASRKPASPERVVFVSRGLENGFKAAPKVVMPSTLTNREMEIIRLISEGHTNKEISEKLFVSPKTKTHISNIYSKLEAKNRAQAISRAREMAILD